MCNYTKKNFECYIANDNSKGQLVVSGTTLNINKFCEELTIKKIKNICHGQSYAAGANSK